MTRLLDIAAAVFAGAVLLAIFVIAASPMTSTPTADRTEEGRCGCLWCGRAFSPRRTGGHRQRFCSPNCRRALDAAARQWIMRALAAGLLSSETLKRAQSNARVVPGPIQREPTPADPAGSDQGQP